jgi:RNA-binding protein 26
MLMEKCWEGHDLKFMWLTSSSSRSDPGGRENSPSTQKGHLEPDDQAAEKLACNCFRGGFCVRKWRAPNLLRESGVDHMELGEDSQPGASPKSGEKESPKGDVC